MNSLLTIGITLHNSAKYLPNLYSDLSAGLKNPQLDILFVDDGSSDESFDLAKSLFGDSCRYICNIENLGVSESRNKIIQNTSAQLLTFVDADDRIELDSLQVLYDSITASTLAYDFDIVLCPYQLVNTNGSVPAKSCNNYATRILCSHELPEMILNYLQLPNRNSYFAQCFSKIYRTEFILSNNIWFDNSLRNFEDVLFIADLLCALPAVRLSDVCFYTHFIHQLGKSETCSKSRSLMTHFGFVKAIKKMKSSYAICSSAVGLNHEHDDQVLMAEAQAIAILTSIALVQNFSRVSGPSSFFSYYREVCIAISTLEVQHAFGIYDPTLAGGSRIFAFLIKNKLALLVVILCGLKFQRRYR